MARSGDRRTVLTAESCFEVVARKVGAECKPLYLALAGPVLSTQESPWLLEENADTPPDDDGGAEGGA